jgi:hypothetical protein
MMFHGTYTSAFYRRVRDVLHEEVAAFAGGTNAAAETRLARDETWRELGETEILFRSEPPEVQDRPRLRVARA